MICSQHPSKVLIYTIFLSSFAACATVAEPIEVSADVQETASRNSDEDGEQAPISIGDPPTSSAREPQKQIGTGDFTNPLPQQETIEKNGDYEVTLTDVTITEAAEAILGTILEESYLVDEQIDERITLRSNKRLNAEGVISLFEAALKAMNADLTYDGTLYRITRSGTALPVTRQLDRGQQAGGLAIAELDFVSAIEMARILEPLSGADGIVRVDSARNLLILDGSSNELNAMQELISVFDRDWMSGMSVAILPIEAGEGAAMIEQLEALFGVGSGGPAEGLIRFIPNEQLASILAISTQPDLLDRAARWVDRLSAPAIETSAQAEIYTVKNRIASDLATVLQAIDTSAPTGRSSTALVPGSDTVVVSDQGVRSGGGLNGGSNRSGDGAYITVDEANNALIIVGDAASRSTMMSLAKRLDVLPEQVLIEATIAEIALQDELEFGVQWFFEEGDGQAVLSDVAEGVVASQFPGFSFVLDGTDGTVVLNALSAVTDVKIVSSPAVMVLNNQTATLQVGDQVPITTQTAQSVTNADTPIINSVELRDTGILLTVTPRVNEEGRVLLEIQQEVSDVVATTTSGIDSPTIQQRRIETTVIVENSQTLLLGGLIQDSESEVITGVPVLSTIPLLGSLFRSRGTDEERTELLLLISPRIIRNPLEATRITEEYRRRVNNASGLLSATED